MYGEAARAKRRSLDFSSAIPVMLIALLYKYNLIRYYLYKKACAGCAIYALTVFIFISEEFLYVSNTTVQTPGVVSHAFART